MKTISDTIEKLDKKFVVISEDKSLWKWKKSSSVGQVRHFISQEIKEILEGLKGEKKDELQLSEKPEGFIGDYVKEMERRIGSNQREQILREAIKEIVK